MIREWPVRFTTHDALLAFVDSDLRPTRATVIERLSHPTSVGTKLILNGFLILYGFIYNEQVCRPVGPCPRQPADRSDSPGCCHPCWHWLVSVGARP